MAEALNIAAIGIFIVFFSLLFISMVLAAIGKIFTKEKKIKVTDKVVEDIDSVEKEKDDGVTPEIVAVITAAVQVAYGTKTKILSIGSIHRESSYGREGRMDIMHSHNLNN